MAKSNAVMSYQAYWTFEVLTFLIQAHNMSKTCTKFKLYFRTNMCIVLNCFFFSQVCIYVQLSGGV